MKGLIIRIVKQMGNDKRTLALILVAPLLILGLIYLLLSNSSYVPKISVDKSFPSFILTELKKQDVTVTVINSNENIDSLLKDKKADAVITMDKNGIHIKMLDAGNTKSAYVTKAFKAAVENLSPLGKMDITYLYGNSSGSSFNSFGFVFLGFISFFFVFLISGISFVRERENGTLERLMTTPVKRWEVVAGYTLGFGIFAAAQSVLITLFTKYVLGLEFAGSVMLAVLIMILLSFTAVSAGAFVSIFANNEFQVMQFIPIVIIPQMFFSGVIPIDTFPYGLGKLAYIMPIYYGCSGLQNVLVRGSGIGGIWKYIGMLLAFILVLFIVNVTALKKYRRL